MGSSLAVHGELCYQPADGRLYFWGIAHVNAGLCCMNEILLSLTKNTNQKNKMKMFFCIEVRLYAWKCNISEICPLQCWMRCLFFTKKTSSWTDIKKSCFTQLQRFIPESTSGFWSDCYICFCDQDEDFAAGHHKAWWGQWCCHMCVSAPWWGR